MNNFSAWWQSVLSRGLVSLTGFVIIGIGAMVMLIGHLLEEGKFK